MGDCTPVLISVMTGDHQSTANIVPKLGFEYFLCILWCTHCVVSVHSLQLRKVVSSYVADDGMW
jgi:hypothetical protein